MERLTRVFEKNDEKYVCIDVCGERCVARYEFCPDCEPFLNVLKKLAEYEDLEEQGLLLKLPCKVGDKFYRVILFCSMADREDKETFRPTRSDCDYWCDCNHNYPCDKEYRIVEDAFPSLESIIHHSKDVGISYFLTRTEAEEALRRMEGITDEKRKTM